MALDFSRDRETEPKRSVQRQKGLFKGQENEPDPNEVNQKYEEVEKKKNFARAKPMKDLSQGLTDDEVVKILTLAYQDNPRNFLLLLLLFRTGRRISEVLELRVKDIDFDAGLILWHIKKKRDKNYQKYKHIMLDVLDNLKQYVDDRRLKAEDYLFYTARSGCGKPMTRVNAWYFLRKYGKQIGRSLHPHQFRHTFAIKVVKNMTNPGGLKLLKDMLEHSDLKITEHYLQFNPAEEKELLEKSFS